MAFKTETYTITRCARCGDHHPVEFKPFTSGPIEVWEWEDRGRPPVKVVISHFGMCPNLNEPLLMNIKPT